MKCNIKEIIEFFDDSNFDNKGDVNAVVSILGEDLNTSVFKHYLETKKGVKVEILNQNVTEGHRGGKWLDRWIIDHTNKIIYQCEIKSWSSTAIDGKILPFDASEEEVKKVSEYNRNKQIKDNYSPESSFPTGTSKVLLTMKKPTEFNDYKLEPLINYWMPISFDPDLISPFSELDIKDMSDKTKFKTLNAFSVSLYLRQLDMDYINLDMPNAERRIRELICLVN